MFCNFPCSFNIIFTFSDFIFIVKLFKHFFNFFRSVIVLFISFLTDFLIPVVIQVLSCQSVLFSMSFFLKKKFYHIFLKSHHSINILCRPVGFNIFYTAFDYISLCNIFINVFFFLRLSSREKNSKKIILYYFTLKFKI